MAEATGKDAIFFQIILTSMKNKPDVDWNIVAEKAGYKDGRTASTRYGQVMKKLTGVTAGQAMAGNGGAAAKVTPRKGKAAKKEVGSGTNTTPSKVVKRSRPSKSKKDVKMEMPEEEEEEEEDEDEEPASDSQMDVIKEEKHYNGHEQEEYASAEEEIDA